LKKVNKRGDFNGNQPVENMGMGLKKKWGQNRNSAPFLKSNIL